MVSSRRDFLALVQGLPLPDVQVHEEAASRSVARALS